MERFAKMSDQKVDAHVQVSCLNKRRSEKKRGNSVCLAVFILLSISSLTSYVFWMLLSRISKCSTSPFIYEWLKFDNHSFFTFAHLPAKFQPRFLAIHWLGSIPSDRGKCESLCWRELTAGFCGDGHLSYEINEACFAPSLQLVSAFFCPPRRGRVDFCRHGQSPRAVVYMNPCINIICVAQPFPAHLPIIILPTTITRWLLFSKTSLPYWRTLGSALYVNVVLFNQEGREGIPNRKKTSNRTYIFKKPTRRVETETELHKNTRK